MIKFLAVVASFVFMLSGFAEEASTNHHKDDHYNGPPWFIHDDDHDCHPHKPPKSCDKCEPNCDCCKDEDTDSSASTFDSLVIVLYPNMGIETLPAFGQITEDISPALKPRQVFKDAVSSAKLQLSDAVADSSIPNKAKYIMVARWRGYIYTKKLIAKL